ncbi:MAG: DUF354 domain-containing protein [archaeon]|nr:DUF354 domain-containing protein [archaeon]MCP8314701.1 DUF354 domain-containing protein [archaeon]MCP8317384.1 DUF354 domain-containing protein [archaeon]MCP8319616.1 DUF354 domain-containing protein [archaeon]
MKVWIDILTPKQALFFKPLIEELKREGHEVLSTSRLYREVNQLSKKIGLESIIVGKHGGGSLYGKLISSSERINHLADLVDEWKPNFAISFSSPECARVAYGLNIKHICINDSPHAQSVAKLTIPLSHILLTPWIIPYSAWTCYGISHNKIIRYKALDPVAWLKRIKPHDLESLDLPIDRAKKTIVIRLEESFASYLLGLNNKWSDDLLKGMSNRFQDNNIVVLCRYEQQLSKILKNYGDKFIIPKEVVIGFKLLKNTDSFIGMGGTMTAESALMGVPTISAYKGKDTYVEDYLIRKKLIVKPRTIKGILKNVERLVDERKKAFIKRRAEDLLKKMEDPIEKISFTVKRLANKSY